MPSKLKKLYHKAKKGLKNIVSSEKYTNGQEAKTSNDKPKPLHEQPLKMMEKTSKAKKDKKGIKEKIKSLKTKPVEKELKRGNTFKKGFKKLKGKVKKLNPIKVKKNKIIGSKKLALLLTSGTIVAILPMFNLATFPALAITSACVFSINFIAVKTLKKVIKQCKLAARPEAEPEKLEEVSVEQAKSKQIFRDGK
ncbi:hypothetical protein [Wolbachia endosymbiont of Armadillidium arcangelii]|uniref:Uncharacterized protein n=1 Tax=Wolbachia endosymbiont of Armadillidium arcangelii TaxID=3158571 RepID=A0AAU7Q0L2_9RICK|nr:hypothetical protein Wxf_00822 [Wolbachia endosymbiont of Armadillidium vulgare]OJH31514.1 hypothetical protein Wxf_00905 [Wolbachia endosymbiont of Armadillidium vulgare]OJH32264.1 hypothetical protein Wxf_01692 [Wolbachia endosymbiont of Armadillidium vulgare]OJH32939.1 hypothetical protein Wxf_02402 [Wolbachia endosymbiont of Armadillidium vulgare]